MIVYLTNLIFFFCSAFEGENDNDNVVSNEPVIDCVTMVLLFVPLLFYQMLSCSKS